MTKRTLSVNNLNNIFSRTRIAYLVSLIVLGLGIGIASAHAQSGLSDIGQCTSAFETTLKELEVDLVPYKKMLTEVTDKLSSDEKAKLIVLNQKIERTQKKLQEAKMANRLRYEQFKPSFQDEKFQNDPKIFELYDELYVDYQRLEAVTKVIFDLADTRWTKFRSTKAQMSELAKDHRLILDIPPLQFNQFYRYSSLRIWPLGKNYDTFGSTVDLDLLSDMIEEGVGRRYIRQKLLQRCQWYMDLPASWMDKIKEVLRIESSTSLTKAANPVEQPSPANIGIAE